MEKIGHLHNGIIFTTKGSQSGLHNKSPNLCKKKKPSSILVVVVKRRHRAIHFLIFGQQLTDASLEAILETIAGRISAPVPHSLGEYRYHRLSTSEWTLDSRWHLIYDYRYNTSLPVAI